MVKKLEEASDGESRRDLAALVELCIPLGTYTYTLPCSTVLPATAQSRRLADII